MVEFYLLSLPRFPLRKILGTNQPPYHQCRQQILFVQKYSSTLVVMNDLDKEVGTSSLPSYLWSLRIFLSLHGSRLMSFCRDSCSAILQLVNQWLNFTYSRSHAFRYGRKNTNPTFLVRIELRTSALAGVQITY